jgi:hypothetical protein
MSRLMLNSFEILSRGFATGVFTNSIRDEQDILTSSLSQGAEPFPSSNSREAGRKHLNLVKYRPSYPVS